MFCVSIGKISEKKVFSILYSLYRATYIEYFFCTMTISACKSLKKTEIFLVQIQETSIWLYYQEILGMDSLSWELRTLYIDAVKRICFTFRGGCAMMYVCHKIWYNDH